MYITQYACVYCVGMSLALLATACIFFRRRLEAYAVVLYEEKWLTSFAQKQLYRDTLLGTLLRNNYEYVAAFQNR